MNKINIFIIVTCMISVFKFQPCYGEKKSVKGTAKNTPENGATYLGCLPMYFSQPKYTNIGTGYSGNTIININQSGLNVLDWIHDAEMKSLNKISSGVMKDCEDNGYSVGAASNINIKFEKPLDSIFMIRYSYEMNCW